MAPQRSSVEPEVFSCDGAPSVRAVPSRNWNRKTTERWWGAKARWKNEELTDVLTSKVVSQLESFAREEKPIFLFYTPHQPHRLMVGLQKIKADENCNPAALDCHIPAARIRAAGILDTQPPEANEELRPAVGALRGAAAAVDVKRLPGIPYGLNQPFERAIKAITGEESYYRWGPSASETPRR